MIAATKSMKSIHDQRYVELVARLRELRKRRGISQKDLGDKLGRPQSFVSKVETCERRLDVVETLIFCKALHIKLESLIPSEFSPLLK